MRTLQEQYNAIKNGNGNKAQFLKQARHLFPQYVNQYSDFDTAAGVLKSKQIISEAAGGVVGKGFDIWDWKKILAEEVKAEEKETSKEVLDAQAHAYDNKDMKNADNVNFNEIMKGFYCEMKDEKNKDKTGDELKAMVVKNLAKDPLYYTKNGEFGTKGVGYTTEAPGLGEPKEPKGKHKSSGYGDLDTKTEKVKANVQDSLGDKEAKTSNPSKVKEMPVTPQNSAGVKKMPMPGSEKTMKLQENKETNDEKIERYEKYTYILNGKEVKPDEIAFYDHLLGAEIDGKLYKLGIPKDGKVELREDIGMFNDPIGYKKSEPNPKDEIFTKKYKGNGVYVIYKNGEEVKTIEGEGNANAWINDEMRKLKEADKSSIASDPEGLKKNNLGTLRQLLDYAEKQDSSEVGKLQSKIWNLLSDKQQDSLISKYAKDPEPYFGMGWDSLPDEISTNIARDKEFKGQTQTEQKLRSLIQQIIKEELNEYGMDSGGQDMTWGMYNRPTSKKDQGNKDFIEKGYNDYYDDIPFNTPAYEFGKNKYYGGADLAKLWQLGWKKAEAEDKGIEFIEDEPNVKDWNDQTGDYDETNLSEEMNWDKFNIQVSSNNYEGTIKRNEEGWMMYDEDNQPEEAGPFKTLNSLMSYYDLIKSDLVGDYVKNLK